MSLAVLATVAAASLISSSPRQDSLDGIMAVLSNKGLSEMHAHRLLSELCTKVGHRLSGSAGYEKAAAWSKARMEELGFENVRLQPCMVPKWVRGREQARIVGGAGLNCCALGGSIGTGEKGVQAEVIEVRSLDEAAKLGEKAKGKILFFNRPMNPTLASTFAAYGGAVDQRTQGAVAAAKVGAVGVLVRSMTLDPDDEPHTGAMRYQEGVSKIPAAALGIQSANRLSETLKKGVVKVHLTLTCKVMPDVESANVIGEIVGSEFPNEVIVMGGHLDSWDKGQGAHDDGSGCMQAVEALRLIKAYGVRPKRTIRVVLFANEENGLRGGRAYADYATKAATKERHVAAIESDSGGFDPRAFDTSLGEAASKKFDPFLAYLRQFGIEKLNPGGGGGADIGPLAPLGTALFGLEPDSQRYFDYHHSNKDTIDKVNARELQRGANAMALLAWILSEWGV